MQLDIIPENPDDRIVNQVADGIKKGKIYILPTDTVYAFATSLEHKSSIETLYRLKDIPKHKPLSLYCSDFSEASRFVRLEDKQVFRWMKSNLPGPYTIVLEASRILPKFTLTKQKYVGVRIIDNLFVQKVLQKLNAPIIGTSVPIDEDVIDPDELYQRFQSKIEAFVSIGSITKEYSTILDATQWPMEILRQGKGQF